MKSKTIIISNPNKNAGRGILTLFEEDNLLKCKLRLYETEKLNKYAKIGIYHKNEVYTANLLEKGGVYFSSLVGNFDMESDFYCAIIKTDNNNEVLLAGGTYAGYYFNNTSVFENNNVEDKSQPEQSVEDKPQPKQEDDCDKCAHCKYKEYFYNSNCELFEAPQPEAVAQDALTEAPKPVLNNPQLKKAETPPTIIEQIVPQFKYIFENYSANEELNKLIENGKFVSMAEGNYSLGAIYKNQQIEYICYAVKCRYNSTPPEELGKNYQWLPLDREDPLSDGYYMVFQDAKDLKIIEI